MIIKGGNVYCKDFVFRKKDLYIANHVIVNDVNLALSDGQVYDVSNKYVIPGLVDIHSHGAYGHDFCDASIEGLKCILKFERENGVTSYCPTSMTYSFNVLKDIFETVNKVELSSDMADIVGINMEGPFISESKKGAQNKQYIQKPDIEMFRSLNSLSNNKIKLVTIAPEIDGALDFISELNKEVNISIGHTEANYENSSKAFKYGANHVTHLCNAMPPFHHRDTGVIGAATDCEDVYVELICDGIHIHPSMIRSIFKLFGSERVCLISDSMEATGMADGEYELGGQKVFKKGPLATLSDGTLAGSASTLFDCMKKAVSFGIPLEDAIKAATVTPAKSIGIYPNVGCLDIGSKADILVLTEELELEQVF